MIVLSLVGQCRCWWTWIGRALKHCRSRWDHLGIIFCRSYNYFRYTSAILEFLGEGNVGQSRHIHQWKPYPQNIGIATEIASISVSVAKLLVLPVLFTVSTSGLHRRVLSLVGQCRCWCRWIGRALKAWNIATGVEITLVSFSVAKL